MEDLPYILSARKGDQKAFSYLLDKYWGYVYGFLLKKVQNEHDAEDISIETFAKAFDKIDSFDQNYSFSTWLISISKNIHIDTIRSQYKKNFIFRDESSDGQIKTIIDETPSVEDKLIKEQNLMHLLECIKRLKSPYREVIQLRFLQEKTYKEIADMTELAPTNVKVVLLRAKKILANIILTNQNNY